ncbi:MAG TPA: hypothetical protein VKD90_05305 [Gemmataceae bacterium]|nr:hypothetical protein [Gemmataceae bacterium]
MPRTPFSALRRWLNPPRPCSPVRRARLGFVRLEDRTVPAGAFATYDPITKVITVTGATAPNNPDDNLSVEIVPGPRIDVFSNSGGKTSILQGAPVPVAGVKGIVVNALDGNDIIAIANAIKAPATMNGGTGSDNLTGGGGNDVIITGADALGDTGRGNDGNDSIVGGLGDDFLFGGKGNDTLTGGLGVNNLDGGAGNDSLTGGSDIDDITGGDGHDVIFGGDGNDRLRGDGGSGKIPGNDTIVAGLGDDLIAAGFGNDSIDAGVGNDRVDGGAGNDRIIGGPDTVGPMQTDDDVLYAGLGNDTVTAGWGNDQLYGEAGRDSLVGGAGMDLLSGGLNRDFFIGHGTTAAGTGTATDAANFDTYKDEFDLTKPVLGLKANIRAIATTELGIQDALAGLAAVANNQTDFNIASRVRYLGTGQYLVKLGPPDDLSSDPGNTNPFGWVPVSFDGTWTDNDPLPSAQERTLAPTVTTEKREFWTVLFHRAMVQSVAPGYDPFSYYTQTEYEDLDPGNRLKSPGDMVEVLTGKPASTFTLSPNPPAGFTFGDIQQNLAAGFWLTAEAKAVPTVAGIAPNQAYAITKAFIVNGNSFITLYNPSGFDKGTSKTGAIDQTGIPKDDGFITISASDFFNSFATGYVN